MLASLPTFDMAVLTTLFDQLKTCLPSMTKDQKIAKLVLAVMRREIQLAGQTEVYSLTPPGLWGIHPPGLWGINPPLLGGRGEGE